MPTTRITPLADGDRATVETVFAGMSPASRYSRFHGPVTTLTPRMLDRLTAVDGEDHVAVVARTGRRRRTVPLGIARIVRTEPRTAELAVEVVDSAQGRGIGRRLTTWARDTATSMGLDVVVAEVLVDNHAMRRLVTDTFPGAIARVDGEVASYRCRVGDAAWSFDAADLVGAVTAA